MAEAKIAYFSMEIGIDPAIPTYSGGLGILAGDTLKSAADLGLPMVGVTLLARKGHFRQELLDDGTQVEHPVEWDPAEHLVLLTEKATVSIDGRQVLVQAWLYEVAGHTGAGTVPIFFLDTDLPGNAERDRSITHTLYGGDEAYRLKQEIVLGIGGARMLQQLGVSVRKYHMNEGHPALLTLELLRRYERSLASVWDESLAWDVEAVRRLCVFTTHTPVEAGHDRFDYRLVRAVMGEMVPEVLLRRLGGDDRLNLTRLALNLSEFVNGVAKRHGEVSRRIFPGYEIHAITNGVHSFTWTSPPMRDLFDRHLPGWANEPELLVRVDGFPDGELRSAHAKNKAALLARVRDLTGRELPPDRLTLGFARRATGYKRADLLLADPARLSALPGGVNVIYAGKAHPADGPGKDIIRRIFRVAGELRDRVDIVYLPDYDMRLAVLLVAGVDVWLNTPLRPLEASGTSGMKAAHNGVPNLSVMDGWWIEGHIEGVTGWSVGPRPPEPADATGQEDAEDLYRKLEKVVLPLYHGDPAGWAKVMKGAIAKNAYYFNSHRMMRRYAVQAYL
jgi:starch phosphorylase